MAKVVFMGTPDFAVYALKALIKFHDVIGVVTQPDRPVGRTQEIQMSPVKEVALAHDIPVFQPEKIRTPEAVEELKKWDADVYVVAAFGQMLSQEVLDIPSYGSINIHASLLPRWRGAAPIQACIRAGDQETGITIMKMDAGLDTGPMLSIVKTMIDFYETGQTLHDRLAKQGADLLVHTLPGYLIGAITPKPQPDNGVTYAPKLKREDGNIDWNLDADGIEQMIRAYTPWPSTYTVWNGKKLKILEGYTRTSETRPINLADLTANIVKPGQVTTFKGRVAIGTGKDQLFYPTKVQLEGKTPVSIEDFIRGYDDFVGSMLDEDM